MQVWTKASGNTAWMASGKPFSPSTTAISTSSTPRFFNSVITRNQNLAPSLCSIHSPRISLVPSGRTPRAAHAARDVDGLVAHHALVAHLDPQGVEEHQRVEGLQRTPLPLGHFLQHGVGDRADQVGG